jgi:hypothetical protein
MPRTAAADAIPPFVAIGSSWRALLDASQIGIAAPTATSATATVVVANSIASRSASGPRRASQSDSRREYDARHFDEVGDRRIAQ